MPTAPGPTARPVLACGEVRTCLLPSFQALDGRAAAQLLRLRADEQVRVSERPNLYALSPETLTGVDCRLPTSNGAKVRAVGTVAARAALTEGRLLQSTAYFSAPAAGPDLRRPWGHYLVRPGVVEPFGRLPEQPTAEGVLRGPAGSSIATPPAATPASAKATTASGLLAKKPMVPPLAWHAAWPSRGLTTPSMPRGVMYQTPGMGASLGVPGRWPRAPRTAS